MSSGGESTHFGPSPYHPGDTVHRGTRADCSYCEAESDDLARADELEREFRAKLAPLAAQAKAIQSAVFAGEAIAELELMLAAGRSDFSPQFEAMWKVGVKQSIGRLKTAFGPGDGG